jgi:pimeloyl-ACP methyl ester carboxylesterase
MQSASPRGPRAIAALATVIVLGCGPAAATATPAAAAAATATPAAATVTTAAATAAAGTTAAGTVTRPPNAPASIRIGQVSLRRCRQKLLSYCGRIAVPLDYSSPASPDIGIGFRWLPAAGHPTGVILAVEGGPGFSSAGSQNLYLAMAGSLLRSRDMLLVNLRGTGNSTPVNCPGLERAGPRQQGNGFNHLVAACGRQLNHTWRYRGGGWVHASDLFNTAYSARDVAEVLRHLKLGRVDLYGDSYGSWFSQVFASRYPGLLRSVTLDSTYQVLDLDPWYTTTVVTARRAFNAACRLSRPCARAGTGSSWARIGQLARRLSQSPVTGYTTSAAGTRTRVTVTALTLVNLVNNAGFDAVVYRDLDAAGRALVQHDDAAPLLRIAALSLGFDNTNERLPGYSDGLYYAVACTDYVQLFSRTAAPAVRARQYRAALGREPARIFAPFSVRQWTSLDQYTEAYSACLDWPAPTRLVPPITRRPPLVPRRLPVLILSGTLDSLTPRLHGATLVARQMGPSARLVTVANLTHVTLQDRDDACPASIYQRFVLRPGRLHSENTSCAARVAPVHAVGSYPRLLADAPPATATRGNTAGRAARQAAAVGVASVADEISRFPLLSGDKDLGLRGGRVTFTPGRRTLGIALHDVRWVSDAAINGTAAFDQQTGVVTASLAVRLAHGPAVHMTARWLVFGSQRQPAVITGSQGRHLLAAVCPPP